MAFQTDNIHKTSEVGKAWYAVQEKDQSSESADLDSNIYFCFCFMVSYYDYGFLNCEMVIRSCTMKNRFKIKIKHL